MKRVVLISILIVFSLSILFQPTLCSQGLKKLKKRVKVIIDNSEYTYDSATEAEIATGISRKLISKYCRNESTPRNGYVWSFA